MINNPNPKDAVFLANLASPAVYPFVRAKRRSQHRINDEIPDVSVAYITPNHGDIHLYSTLRLIYYY